MKLAIDCRMCGKSGIGAFIDGILPSFIASGHELLLIGLDEPCAVAPFSFRETFFFPRALAKKINACDAYITPYCNIPSGIRIPIYSTIHDIVFLDMPKLAGTVGTLVRTVFYQHAIRRSRALFTVSEFSKQRICKKLSCKKPIQVVHSSVPAYLQEPLNPLPAKTDTIIFIGNIKRHKGLHTLIPAFLQLRAQCAKDGMTLPRLLIVGEKEHFRTQDTALPTLQAMDGIEFTGFISNAVLKLRLSQARILVQPSLYEGFGLPPLEALCCGTKAVVSDIPVFKEVYEGLPVTYFKTEDSDDLAQKLLSVWQEPTVLTPTKNRYSFAKTAAAMLSVVTANAM